MAGETAAPLFGDAMCSFRPRRSMERPVPPPSATIRIGFFGRAVSAGMSGKPRTLAACAFSFRIKKLSEARIFLKKSEVLIVSRAIAIIGAQLVGDFQICHRGFGFASQAIERGHG